MKLLVVGGGGYVGTIVKPALEAEYDCIHFDLRPVEGAKNGTIVADVGNDSKVRQAVIGMDSVLYMAMGAGKSDPSCNDLDAAFDVNVKGLYRFLHHSLSSGVQRFIYISTLSVYFHYWKTIPMHEDIPADNWWGAYGLSKRVGEFICQAASQEYPSTTIMSLRLMWPRNEKDWPSCRYNPTLTSKCEVGPSPRNKCALGPNDTRRLFVAAVKCDRPGYHLVQATGDIEEKLFSHKKIRELLGWEPKNE